MKLKNILLMSLCMILVVALTVTGTVAYLTDRDSKVNTFTVGDVSIKLDEIFDEDDAALIPGVKIEKKPTITNTGKNDAYVWMLMKIPALLDDENAELGVGNVLHWNMPGCFWYGYHNQQKFIDSGIANGFITEGVEDGDSWINENEIIGTETIDGIKYNVYAFLYKGAIEPEEKTNFALQQVYVDTAVDITPEGEWYFVKNGVATAIGWDNDVQGQPKIIIEGYAMQTDGFDTVEEAFAAYNTQWGVSYSK